MGSLTLNGAMRLIAIRHRVMCRDLITETTEEKISVWLYPSESSIAEVIVSGGTLPRSLEGLEYKHQKFQKTVY